MSRKLTIGVCLAASLAVITSSLRAGAVSDRITNAHLAPPADDLQSVTEQV